MDQHHVLRALRQLQGERLLGIEGVIDPRRRPRALIEPGAIAAKHRMPAARLAHPAHRAREPVVRGGRGQKLDRHPPLRRPVRGRLVEGDAQAPALPARDDSRRRIAGRVAPGQHPHDGADADLRGAQLASAGPGVGDQRASGEARLLDRFHVVQAEPHPDPLSKRKPGEPVLLGGPFPVEQRTEPVEVLVEVHRVLLYSADRRRAWPPSKGTSPTRSLRSTH